MPRDLKLLFRVQQSNDPYIRLRSSVLAWLYAFLTTKSHLMSNAQIDHLSAVIAKWVSLTPKFRPWFRHYAVEATIGNFTLYSTCCSNAASWFGIILLEWQNFIWNGHFCSWLVKPSLYNILNHYIQKFSKESDKYCRIKMFVKSGLYFSMLSQIVTMLPSPEVMKKSKWMYVNMYFKIVLLDDCYL